MEKMNKPFPDRSAEYTWPNLEDSQNRKIHIADKRVAQLLLVLHELDESVAGLEDLPKAELSELVSKAILACGFVGPIDARYAIAAVLETIESGDSVSGNC
jgi:hypothetical protein